jgi:lysophospholipase L1-like esterase
LGAHSATRRLTRTLAAIAACAAAACAWNTPAGAAEYLALGDSTASGDGTAGRAPGSPQDCWRRLESYPFAAARGLSLSLDSVACSGATLTNMAAAQDLHTGSAPAQLDSITGSERVISLTIGANDAQFSELERFCMQTASAVATPCGDHFTEAQIRAFTSGFGPALGSVLDAIHMAAPAADVFLIGYLPFSPPDTACWGERLRLTSADAPLATLWATGVRDTQRAAAIGHGATFIDAYTEGSGHDACADADQRWVFAGGDGGAFLHPNATGQRARAELLAAAVRSRSRPPADPPGSPVNLYQEPPVNTPGRPPARIDGRLGSRLLRPCRSARPPVLVRRGGCGLALAVTTSSAGAVEVRFDRRTTRWRRTGVRASLRLPRGDSTLWLTGRNGARRQPSGTYRVTLRTGDGASWTSPSFRIAH